MTEKVDVNGFIDSLKKYLLDRRIVNRAEYNVGSLDPSGKYKIIPDEYTKTFLNRLARVVHFSEKKYGPVAKFALTERSCLYAPLRIDFDISQKCEERIYTRNQVKALVGYVFKIIDQIRDPAQKFLAACVLLEKPAPRLNEKISTADKKLYKDGFHLHFNFIVDDWTFQYINQNIKIWFDEQGPTGPFEDPKNNYITIKNDEGIHRVDWLLYGCAKSIGSHYYKATRFYVNIENEDDPAPEVGESLTRFVTRVGVDEIFDYFPNGIPSGGKQPPEYYLPYLLSIRGYQSCTPLSMEIIKEKENSRVIHKKTRVVSDRSDVKIMEDLKTIQDGKFLDHLKQERADEYDMWMDVGRTLYGISAGDSLGLELWTEFSKRSDKFQDGECEMRWEKMKPNKRTMGSLIFMLNEDDPEFMREYWKNQADYLFRESVKTEPSHRNVAVIIHKLKKDFFIYTGKKWYTYGDHRIISETGSRRHYWKKMEKEVDLRLFIQEDMLEYYKDYETKKRAEIRAKKLEEGQDVVEKEITKMPLISNIRKMIQCLGQKPFINGVVSLCETYFMNEKFEELKDMNKTLIACENGVIDLENKVFRNGRPDDYITISTGLYFNPDINERDEKALDTILDKIYPDPRHKAYIYKHCAAMLYGKNLLKMIPCHIGPTNAGKSVLMTLLRNAFGKYAKELKKEKIVAGSVKSSGGPDIELYRLRGARVVIVPELEKRDSLDIGFLKTLSAALDKIYARTHHDDEGLDMEITFTVLFQLNDFPKVPGEDEALWGRFLCLQYYSEFVKPGTQSKNGPVPKTIEEQFKKRRFAADMMLDDKLKGLANVFLAKIFKVWNESVSKFQENPSIMDPPEEFVSATKNHRDQFDTVSAYIRDNIRVETLPKKITKEYKSTTFCSTKTLFSEYNDWYKIVYVNYKQSTNLFEFSSLLEKKLGRAQVLHGKDKGFIGIRRLKECEDEGEAEEDGEEESDNE